MIRRCRKRASKAAVTSGKDFRKEQAGEGGCRSRKKDIVAEREGGKRRWDTLRRVRGAGSDHTALVSHVTELILFTI